MPSGPRTIGDFCWINILSPKPEVEREFYSKLFGWTYAEIPGMGHRVMVGGKAAGGLFPNTSPDGKNTAAPAFYVMVRTADAVATGAKATALGGAAEPPMDIGPIGRMVALTDPAGAKIDVWQSHDGAVMESDSTLHGAPSWYETITTDAARATKFYCDLFGWTAETMPMGESTYTVFKRGGEQVAGLMPRLPHMGGVPSHWGVYVTVTDVDATARQVAALGGTLCMEPTDIPNVGRFCMLQSPSGVMCYAITYKP